MRLEDATDLVGFAAQADDEHGSKVGMARIAGQGTAQDPNSLTLWIDCAATAMRQRDYSVHVRIIAQRFGMNNAPVMICDCAGHRGGAVHAGENADVVTR